MSKSQIHKFEEDSAQETTMTKTLLFVCILSILATPALAHPSVLPQFAPGKEMTAFYARPCLPSYRNTCNAHNPRKPGLFPYAFKKRGPAGLLSPLLDK
jgi:hypothetical protein